MGVVKKIQPDAGMYPRFAECRPFSRHTSDVKRLNLAKGSAPEKLLRIELRRCGLKFFSNYGGVLGVPDFVVKESKIAVFCDGDFWHGKDWKSRRRKLELGHNGEYWRKKIEANIRRDQRVNRGLRLRGWKVLRFWESEIKRQPSKVADIILNAAESNRFKDQVHGQANKGSCRLIVGRATS
jgi:DNA mismatch endonuclease Vsr